MVELEMDGEEERSEAGGALVLGEVVLGKVRGGKTGERTEVGGKDRGTVGGGRDSLGGRVIGIWV